MGDTQERKAIVAAIAGGHPWASFVGRGIERTGITITRFARLVGVNRSTVYRWLEGRVQELSTTRVEAVAAALHLDVADALAAAGHAARAKHDSASPSEGFAVWLTRTRQVSGYATTEHLSRETGIDRNKLIEWETGEGRPTISEALILGRALKLTGALGHLKILAAAGYIDPAVQAVQELVTDPDPDAQESAAALRRVIDSMTRRAG